MKSGFYIKSGQDKYILVKSGSITWIGQPKSKSNLMDGTILNPFRVVLGWAYRGLTGVFLLLQNFSVAISVIPHVCLIYVLILISMFLR